MKYIKSWRKALVVLVATGLLLSGCSTQNTNATKSESNQKSIKVAFMTPISGNYATNGKIVDPAVRIALEDFNKGSEVKIDLLFEDSGSTPVSAKNALDKLLEQDPSAIFNGATSPLYGGFMPKLAEKKIATVVLSGLPTIYENGWNWIFGTTPSAAVETVGGLQYLHDKLGKSKIALLLNNDDLGKAVLETLKQPASANGITLFPVFFTPGDNDFTGNITAAGKNNPDAYLTIASVDNAVKQIRQMKQLGIQEPIIGVATAYQSFLKVMDPQEVEGLYGWTASLDALTSTDPKVQAFVKRYKELSGLDPDSTSLHAYDGAMMLFTAAAKAGGDKQKIIENMHAFQNYKGLAGTYNYDAKGRGQNETNIIRIGPNKQIKFLENMKIKLD